MPGGRYVQLLERLEAARAFGVSLGLDRVHAALAGLGNPERQLRAVQIAGTNGKGSAAAMTEAILRAAGLRTGLFTSPHLCRFTERFRIDGVEVDGDALAALDERLEAVVTRSGLTLTYFERATVLAFFAFAEAKVEIAVFETGLGGRLDATTTCVPIATAITSIGYDHTDVLGATLEDIAREKAGIAKPNVPLFIAALPAAAESAIAEHAARVGAPLVRVAAGAGDERGPPSLAGKHQLANAAIATALAQAAGRATGRAISDAAVSQGLSTVRWPGRLERVGDVLFDCAHNPEGAAALAAALGSQEPAAGPRALVVSIVRDKAAAEILACLAPVVDVIFATTSGSDRALSPDELAALVPAPGPAVVTMPDCRAALQAGRDRVTPHGLVVVAGSIFLVGALRAHLLGETCDPIATADPPASPR